MHRATHGLMSQQIRNIKWHRQFSRCAVSRRSGNVIKSPLPDVVIPEMAFHERLWKNSAGYLNQVAIECVETNNRYTYKELQNYTSRFATSLRQKLELSDGDRVAVMMPNCPEYPVVAIGTMQAGCVLTTINPVYKEFEVTHQMTLTTPKVVVTTPETYSIVLQGLKNAKTTARIIVVDQPGQGVPQGTLRYSEIAVKSQADYELLGRIVRTHEDTAFIPFSSGTTGLPKGVELSYRAFLAGLDMLENNSISHVQMADSSHQDIIPSILPFFHVYGFMIVMMAHLATGCKLITSTKFNPETYFRMLKDYKATILYVVPPLVTLLSKHPEVTAEHLASIKNINCGAAPMSASDADPLIEKSKGKMTVSQGFGATETLALTTATLIDSEIDYASCGVPLSNMEIKFVNPQTGEDVPVGEEGELYIRGASLMKGYYKNEKATKESITDDGFYKSGDLGYYKLGLGMYISDRIKELIKVKGMQVAPAELEGLLRSHPLVDEAAVIGIPHEISGETPKAFIIPKKGKKVSAQEIQDFVASNVAPFKKIQHVQFVDDIPKTASGKILRRELKKMYA